MFIFFSFSLFTPYTYTTLLLGCNNNIIFFNKYNFTLFINVLLNIFVVFGGFMIFIFYFYK